MRLNTSLQLKVIPRLLLLLALQPVYVLANPDKQTQSDIKAADSTSRSEAKMHQLDHVTVTGNRITRDSLGANLVFEDSITSEYLGKEYIERYKGANPADIFRGTVGVFSSDARNSGAVVPNIRGVQDFGRVPLTIDGTNQSIVVYRGMGGVSTRSYIDPMLISGMRIMKGGSIHPRVKVGNAGGVAMTTLEPNDVVPVGQKFGMDFKLELSNNTTSPRIPVQPYGMKNEYMKPWPIPHGGSWTGAGNLIDTKQKDDSHFGQFKDYAYRVAAAYKGETFDILFAHAQRNKGNHYSGKNNAAYYTPEPRLTEQEQKEFYMQQLRDYNKIADGFIPGDEVPNTSFRTNSELLKLTWQPNNDHIVKLGVRYTDSRYGDIMPSRLVDHVLANFRWDEEFIELGLLPLVYSDNGEGRPKLPQWPLSSIKTTAVNLDYRYNPEDNDLIDIRTGLWGLRAHNRTMNSGGSVLGTYSPDVNNKDIKCDSSVPDEDVFECLLFNSALMNNIELRKGLNLSNRFQFNDKKISITPFANYEHEKIHNHDDLFNQRDLGGNGYAFVQEPRKGRRASYNLGTRFEWATTSWLDIDASFRYTNTWAYNDRLDEKREKGLKTQVIKDGKFGANFSLMNFRKESWEDDNQFTPVTISHWHNHYWRSKAVFWWAREDGKLYKEDNPYLQYLKDPENSPIVILKPGESPIDYIGQGKDIYLFDVKRTPGIKSWLNEDGVPRGMPIEDADGNYTPLYKLPDNIPESYIDPRKSLFGDSSEDVYLYEKKRKYHGWSGSVGASFKLNDNNRMYLRYSSILRTPSLFESTSGFGNRASISARYVNNLVKPERTNHFEIGYIYNLKELLQAGNHADIKLSYYNDKTHNYIDRDGAMRMINFDRYKISGWELQSRYDNGRWFGDFSVAMQLNNKVCNEQSAWMVDPVTFKQAYCVRSGWYNTQARAAAAPKYSMALHLGSRWLNDKLEMGTRVTYHSKRPNDAYDQLNLRRIKQDVLHEFIIQPLNWNNMWLLDAYVNYKISKNVDLELMGTNLSNRYYLDPLTRAHNPAPGRTVKLGVHARF